MLVDGDNAQPGLMEATLAETEKYGAVIARRVYGNWANSGKSAWKTAIHASGMLPVQQFAYVPGKNATDMALIIEAMDLLHSGTVNGFCIVSSDSDYTRLAIRIREAGMFVMGVGRPNTPKSFVAACEVFVQTDSLAGADKPTKAKTAPTQPVKQQQPSSSNNESWVPILVQAIGKAAKQEGWAHLGLVGHQLKQISPGFIPKDYGHKQLGQLIQSRTDVFEKKGSQGSTYIRVKPR